MDDIRAKIIFTDAGASAALGKVTAAATATGAATKTAGASIGQFGSTIGLAGQAVGRLSPALGGLVSMAGSATGAIQGLATAGLGPLGLAVAGVSLAVSAGTALWTAYKQRTDDAAQATREAAEATRDSTIALRANLDELDKIINRRRTMTTDASRTSRIALGAGSLEEQDALVTQRQDAVGAARRASSAPLSAGANIDSQRAQRAIDLEVAERALAAAIRLRSEAQTRADAESQRVAPSAAAPAAPGRARRGGSRATGPSLDDLMGGGGDLSALAGERTSDDPSGDNGKDQLSDRYAEQQALAQEHYDRMQDLTEDAADKRRASAEEEASVLKAISEDTFGALQEGIAASADAMINGGASAEQAGLMIVAALANQLSKVAMMEGLKEAALAAASFASYDYPSAAMHLAAAGAWTLVGAAAGVAGGALSAAAQPSGAGPSTGAGPAPRQQTAAEEGARNITINFAGGVITAATEAQLARTIRRTVSNTALGAT